MLKSFLADASGATSIEYGLICAGLALAIITIIQSLGGNLVALLFDDHAVTGDLQIGFLPAGDDLFAPRGRRGHTRVHFVWVIFSATAQPRKDEGNRKRGKEASFHRLNFNV